MDLYFNATDGELHLPRPDRAGALIVGPGESFRGSPYYDKFIKQGLLAKVSGEPCVQKGYVTTDDTDDTLAGVADSAGPFRYKSQDDSVGPTCVGLIKYMAHLTDETKNGDIFFVTYYFYCHYDTPTVPSHVITRQETMRSGWAPPVWADLPSDFYDLSPVDQRDALLATTG